MTIESAAVAALKPRFFAIIPAAGYSRRMGAPKLLLPFRNATVIDRVLDAWSNCQVDEVVVVCRRDDRELADCCAKHNCTILQPTIDPPDMKASVLHAIDHLEEKHQPQPYDAWLLTPADSPTIQGAVINQLLRAYREQARIESADPKHNTIFAPSHENRRGHPVLFPWSLIEAVRNIPADQGINQLLRRFPVQDEPVETDTILQDMDTPADYRALQKESNPPLTPPDQS